MVLPLSIIIPVYKVEPYICQCIDSILNQSFKNFELILVNDGSPDNCGRICEEYAQIDKRIKVIHQENQGLTAACITGINNATGQYIGFVDSDDWIDHDMYEKMINKLLEYKVDIVCCDLTQEYGNRKVCSPISNISGYFNREELEMDIIPILVNDGSFFGKAIRNNRVTKIFKADLIRNNLIYYTKEIVYGEDYQLVFPCILDAKGIYIFENYYPYHYRLNNSSLTRTYVDDMWEKYLKLNRHIESISESKKVYDFKSQVLKELLYFAIMSIDNEFFKGNNHNYREKIKVIKNIIENERLRNSLKEVDLQVYHPKVKFIVWLMKKRKAFLLFFIKELKSIIR